MTSFSPASFDQTAPDLSSLIWLGEQVPGGFFIYRADDTQELLYANRALWHIFGCTTEDEFRALTGYTFRGLVHPEDYETIQKSIDRQIAAKENNRFDYVEYRIVRRDGEVRWADDYGHFAKLPGYGDVYYVFLWDATNRRNAKEEAFRMELELEKEKRTSEIKNGFLFNLSHDLRTPMNAILGFSELASQNLADPDLAKSYLEKVSVSGKLLLSLIDDMLEMSRLGGGDMRLKEEKTDLKAELNAVCELFRATAERAQITLIKDLDLPEETVLIDKNRLFRIFNNLVDNAIKFTPKGGSVTLSAKADPNPDETGKRLYTFTVSDTGVGISEEFSKRIFEVFERENSSTQTGKTGTGLGLSIVKTILNLMGGTITVDSKKDHGSTFTVKLSLMPAAAEPELKELNGKGKRILIVEDVAINRMLTETVLKNAGFAVQSAENGEIAVQMVRDNPPGTFDLILMDIQMPVMNGYDATRAIRALGRGDAFDLPILALSANAGAEDRRQSQESGMNGHIAKPFVAANLIRSILEEIDRRKESR